MWNIPALRVAKDIHRKLTLHKLKPRQRRFVIAYAGSGDIVQSVAQAGYKVQFPYQAKNTAHRLLKVPTIRENLELLDLELESELIANSAECKAKITEIMRDPDTEPQHALSAAKMLLQANGDLDPRLRLEIESRTHEIKEYYFAGPKSNFLKSREEQSVIDVPPEA